MKMITATVKNAAMYKSERKVIEIKSLFFSMYYFLILLEKIKD